jgi:DNA-binding NtrC family response regulator
MREGGALEFLVVDDDARIRESLSTFLAEEGHRTDAAADAESALRLLQETRYDAVLLDVKMPGMSGLVALMRIAELDPELAVVIVSGEDTITSAREAIIHLGAFDVVAKPPEPEHLLAVARQAAELTRQRRRGTPPGEADLGLVGESAAFHRLMDEVRRVAPSEGKVLISGENGTGKELVASAIHALSRRASGPLVKLNCAALPRDLVESELFGYERGAFTGAQQAKKGRLELAHGGTLLLDEVGDLSLESQAKLLRAIEAGELERLGGTRTVPFDVRVVAATNKDLAAEIEADRFREDLFHRLNVLPLHVPPLRERKGDVPLLARHFLERFCAREGVPAKRLTAEALELLSDYAWPGNVRELRNLMERAAILVQAPEVDAGDLAHWLADAPADGGASGLRGQIEIREAETIRKALESAGWNVTQAAAGLGIDRTNLHRKMRKYGIQRRAGG